jgi:hypothetical protein
VIPNPRLGRCRRIGTLLVLLTACSEAAQSPVQPNPLDIPLRFLIQPCHSSMSTTQCSRINRAIDHLKAHSDPMCRTFGQNAYQRNKLYNNYQYHYHDTWNAWSGGSWEPDAGAVFISQLGFANQGGTTLAGLSAHEEYHLLFPNDPDAETHALEWEAWCEQGFVP